MYQKRIRTAGRFLLAVLAIGLSSTTAWAQFAPVSVYYPAIATPQSSFVAMAAGDVTGDGLADCVVSTDIGLNVLINQGNGVLGPPVRLDPGNYNFYYVRPAIGDLNLDGLQDIVVPVNGGDNLLVLYSQGSGNFTAPVTYSCNPPSSRTPLQQVLNPGVVELADLNNDGRLDIVVSSAFGHAGSPASRGLSIILGTPTGFGQATVYNSYPAERSLTAIGDYDNDGYRDLFCSEYNGVPKVFLGSASGLFTMTTLPTADLPYAVKDLDGDGLQDLIVNGGVRYGQAGGGHAARVTTGVSYAKVADINGDGILDLVDIGYSATMNIALGQGNRSFAAPYTLTAPAVADQLGDANGDGLVDVFRSTASTTRRIGVMLNTSTPAPALTGISPAAALPGTALTLTGLNMAGATAVTFSGTAGNVVTTGFTVNATGTQITGVVVPAGAVSGPVTVTTPRGISSGKPFTVLTNLVVSAAQQVSAGAYYNLTVTGSGAATLSGPVTVAGTLLVQAGGTLNTNCQPVRGAGGFALAAGATLQLCDAQGLRADTTGGPIRVGGRRFLSPAATYVYSGTQAQVTGAGLPAQVRNLVVANPAGVTLSQPVAVRRLLELQNAPLTLNGQMLTLRSDADSTALVAVTGAGATVQGNATVERYVPANANPGPGYRHLAAPVGGATVGGLTTTSFTPVVNAAYNTSTTPNLVTPFPTVFGYDEARQTSSPAVSYGPFDRGWVSPASLTEVLAPGRGYTVNLAPGQTLRFVGPLGQGDVPLTLTSGSGADAGWHLLGNPYPAVLDWSRLTPPAGLAAAVYTYQSNGTYTGGYRAYVNGIGNPLVAMGQAFFVRVSQPNTSVGLMLTDALRTADFSPAAGLQRGTETRPLVRLALAGAGLSDEATVYCEAGATPGLDAAYDAPKLRNPHGLNLAAVAAGRELAINGLPALSAAVTVPLTVSVPQAGSYQLRAAEVLNLGPATLHDALTGQDVDLTRTPTYTFTTAGSATLTGRFALRLEPARVLATRARAAHLGVYPNPARGQVRVVLPAGSTQVTLHNALGQLVRTAAGQPGQAETSVSLDGLAPGLYTLRAGVASTRLLVEP